MLLKELPTLLHLHHRDAKKNPDTRCRRCGKAQEDQTHWLICDENQYKIEDA
ncbi:31330_t:CDS:1, partial [Gigaspora margarita]